MDEGHLSWRREGRGKAAARGCPFWGKITYWGPWFKSAHMGATTLHAGWWGIRKGKLGCDGARKKKDQVRGATLQLNLDAQGNKETKISLESSADTGGGFKRNRKNNETPDLYVC